MAKTPTKLATQQTSADVSELAASKNVAKATALAEKMKRFADAASKKVTKAIAAIEAVGDLAKINGAYSTTDVAKIEGALNGALDAAMKRFETALKGGESKPTFTL